jgi:hypothetical protein
MFYGLWAETSSLVFDNFLGAEEKTPSLQQFCKEGASTRPTFSWSSLKR